MMSKRILAIALIGLVTIFSSCANKVPLTEEQKVYAGKWVTNDGTWLQIYNNGGGDYKMSNSNVTGGGATITDDKITIELFGIKGNFRIDEAPFEEDGEWYMILTGNTYQKQ